MKISNIVFGLFLILDLTLSIKAINEVNTFKPCFPYENCTDDGQAECKDLGGKCCGEYCCNIQYFEALQKFEYNEEDDTCKYYKSEISYLDTMDEANKAVLAAGKAKNHMIKAEEYKNDTLDAIFHAKIINGTGGLTNPAIKEAMDNAKGAYKKALEAAIGARKEAYNAENARNAVIESSANSSYTNISIFTERARNAAENAINNATKAKEFSEDAKSALKAAKVYQKSMSKNADEASKKATKAANEAKKEAENAKKAQHATIVTSTNVHDFVDPSAYIEKATKTVKNAIYYALKAKNFFQFIWK